MSKKNVAILYGGFSEEYEISIKSAEQICNWLDKERYNIYPVLVTKEGWKYPDKNGITIDKNFFGFIKDNQVIKFDFAFIIIHGSPGENGLLTGYLDTLGIPYSTSRTEVLSLTFNKHYCKVILSFIGITTPDWLYIKAEDYIDIELIKKKIGYPLFVKPCNSGSSIGTSKVFNEENLSNAVKRAFSVDNQIIIEKAINGIELSCGVFKTKSRLIVLPVTEIVPKKEFFDYEAKYISGMSEEITPARINSSLYTYCQEITKKICNYLNCYGFSRIDYILKDNQLYFLEINTIPGMSSASIIPQQVKYLGLNMTDLLTNIIEEAF